MPRTLIILGLAALVAGCASRGGPADSGSATAAHPGARFALRACAGCHAVGVRGESPNSQSPPFRTLAGRLPGEAPEESLQRIAERGHGQMPPIYMTPEEIRQVAAYIRAVAAAERPRG